MVKYWQYKKESAACKSFYVFAKKEPLIPLIWFEASLNSFQVMALRNFKEIRKFKPQKIQKQITWNFIGEENRKNYTDREQTLFFLS